MSHLCRLVCVLGGRGVSARPRCERRPQRGHVSGLKAEGREDRVAPVVEPASGVGEVPLLEPGVEAAGEGDHLVDGVMSECGGGVDVVARFGPAGFSELRVHADW
jgi:hypothetical protein